MIWKGRKKKNWIHKDIVEEEGLINKVPSQANIQMKIKMQKIVLILKIYQEDNQVVLGLKMRILYQLAC